MAELVAYRLAAWDTPLWVSANRAPGRFNRAGDGPVQYWSLHPLTPWAEYLRAQGIRSLERLRALRLRLWAARLGERPTRLDFDAATRAGLEPGDLVADDHAACQRFGARCLRGNGPAVVIVPSAALPGTDNLVVFGPRVAAPYALEPVDDTVDVPTAVAAEDGHALPTLLDAVRHIGEAHAAFEAWRRGRVFTAADPPVPR